MIRRPRGRLRTAAAVLAIGAISASLTACGGGGSSSGAVDPKARTTITWWTGQADQAETLLEGLAADYEKLHPNVTVKVSSGAPSTEDLLAKLSASFAGGNYPDISYAFGSWASQLEASNRTLDITKQVADPDVDWKGLSGAARATAQPTGKKTIGFPALVDNISLLYNTKLFAQAGVSAPTDDWTWDDFRAAAKKLTDPSKSTYGMAMEGGSYTEGVHFAYIFGKQHGADPFDSSGKPDFTSDGMVAGVKQYVDLMGTNKVVNPSSAQYKNGPEAPGDFAKGKAAMLMSQNNADNTLQADGMKSSEYGVVPIPSGGDSDTASFVAGINLSIFKNTKNPTGAMKFVKFMTSKDTQATLDKPFTALPVVKGGTVNFTDSKTEADAFQSVLNERAEPLPLVPAEAAYETNVGNAVNALVAQAATGKPVTDADIKAALKEAEDKMASAG